MKPTHRALLAKCLLIASATGCGLDSLEALEADDEQPLSADLDARSELYRDEEQDIVRIVGRVLGRRLDEISPAQTFAQLGASDLEVVEIVTRAEARFEIALSDQEIEETAGTEGSTKPISRSLTIGRLVSLVRRARTIKNLH
ncbi:MAG: acyl carrier protein [Isosphaeraceae bacterium]|nr:acyl carrier protein [Isosphaeraceae bacterium]